jgi:hypothetical protein
MARHTRYYDTHTQAVIAWLALHAVALWCALRPRHRHRPGEGRFPVSLFIPRRPKRAPSAIEWPGADPDWADQIHAWNSEDTVVRDEVRA